MSTSPQMIALTVWIGFNLTLVLVLMLLSAFRQTPPLTDQDQ